MEEAQSLMVDLERLVKERDRERHSLSAGTNRTLAGYEVDTNDFHEKMELCDACGSFLVIGDTQGRVDAHLLGKQHMGFSRIRSAISELRVSLSLSLYNVCVCVCLFVCCCCCCCV